MDSTLDIRKKIHDFIDTADERILRIFAGIISAEENEHIPASFYDELDKRRERHLKGESKSYTWEEVKARIESTSK